MAGVTGLEPAASGVTGRHSNQLSYTPKPRRAVYCTPGTLSSNLSKHVLDGRKFRGGCDLRKALLQPSVGTAREKIRGVSAILLDLIFNPLRDFLFLLLVI